MGDEMKIRARFEVKLQDCWIGLFWKRSRQRWIPDDQGNKWESIENERCDMWMCLVPCLPLHVLCTWADERYSDTETLDRICDTPDEDDG